MIMIIYRHYGITPATHLQQSLSAAPVHTWAWVSGSSPVHRQVNRAPPHTVEEGADGR